MMHFFYASSGSKEEEARYAEARRRFSILIKLALLTSAITFTGGMAWLYQTGAELHPGFVGAIFVAIFGTMLLAAALMGLVFFSSLSGVDDEADANDSWDS